MKKYILSVSPEMGRGLYSNPITGVNKDDLIALCELLVLSPVDTAIVNITDLKHYTFKFDAERDCLVLGDGEIFNHSHEPNVSYELVDFGDRKMMRFVALRDIQPGEQLFIDYNADTQVDTAQYCSTKSLVG
jgi:hypothetical protein